MIEDRIKHRHLTCFEEVARQKSIGRAAQALAVSQPAVSKTIRELEEILGLELFDRSHRSVVLTAGGEVFLSYALASISALRQGVEAVDPTASGTARSVIRIGALPSAAGQVLPAAVGRFARRHPNVVVRVVTGDNAALLADLRAGELDVALAREACFSDMLGIAFEHLYREHAAFIVRPDHPLVGGAAVADQLAAFTLLVPPPNAVPGGAIERLLARLGIGPGVRRLETASPVFARAYVESTDAVWLAQAGEAGDDLAAGRLAVLDIDGGDAIGAVGLARRIDGETPGAAQTLLAEIRAVVTATARTRR